MKSYKLAINTEINNDIGRKVTLSFIAVNPSSTIIVTRSATSLGLPFESTRAQILTFDTSLDAFISSFEGWSMLRKSEPCLAASALRIAISRPHLTLGRSEDGYTTQVKRT